MSFINWGEESPEQKQIRRRFEEEQAMFEQAVMMANAANASAAAAAAAGGSKLGESLPAYCGGDKKIADINYWGMDVLKDKRYIPSDAEFDALVYDGDADNDQRNFRDSWYQAQDANLLSIEFYNRPATAAYPSPTPAPGIFYRTDLLADSKISLYSENVNSYEQWAGSGADVELPGVTRLNTLPAIENPELPNSGSPGDIVYRIDSDTWYAWNQSLGEFSSSYYNDYIAETHQKMKESRDNVAKSKNELILALQPLLWTAKYIPEFRIKKDNL